MSAPYPVRDCVTCGHPCQRNRTVGVRPPAGVRRLEARGMCSVCYARQRRTGSLVRPVGRSVDKTATDCPRCTTPTIHPTGLCTDCREVLTDLGELAAWAS